MPTDNLPAIRTSERTTFKRCPQRWWWSYREGLKPKGPPNKNLWFGTGIHLALSEWYCEGTVRGVHPLETWKKYVQEEMVYIRVYAERFEADEKVYEEAGELGEIMLTEYLKEYGDDEHMHFIATERPFQIKVPGPDGKPVVLYLGTFDGVYRDLEDGKIKLLETKTAAAISTSHLDLDDQAGSYWAVANSLLRQEGLLLPGQRIGGVTYNFLRKSTPDPRPRHPDTGEYTNKPTKEHYIAAISAKGDGLINGKEKVEDLKEIAEHLDLTVLGEISKVQPLPNFHRHYVRRSRKENNTQIRRIADEAAVMDAYRYGRLPIIKTPRSTGHDACQHGCEFYTMCTLHESGADWRTVRDSMFKVEDPYADHRKSAHMAT